MSSFKILIVQDDPAPARDLATRVTALGHGVSAVVTSGREALEAVAADRPALVLVDLGLRDRMGGLETAYRLRFKFGVPVVFLIDSPDERLPEGSEKPFPSAYITRPYQDGEIEIALKRALRLDRESPRTPAPKLPLIDDDTRYQKILDTIEDGYYEVDLAGTMIVASESLCRLYGYAKDEFLGLNYKDYTGEETARKVFEAYHRVFTTGRPIKKLDWEIIKRNGTTGQTEVSISLIRDEHGQGVGFRGIVRDVTDRWLAEQALRASEERYRSILDSIEDVYYEVDLAGNFVMFSQSLERMYGYSRDELMGMNYRAYIQEEYIDEVFETFNRVYTTGEPASGSDWETVTKDGSTIHLEASISLIRDARGEPTGFRGIIRDITERHRAEQALKESEERYRLLAEEAHDVIWSVDLQTMRFTQISPSVERLLGLTVPGALGRDFAEVFGPELNDMVVESLDARGSQVGAAEDDQRQTGEFQVRHRDGRTIWVEATIAFYRDDGGRPLGIVGVARDVTSRKRAESEREELISTLQQTLTEVKTLSGLLPICASCKKVRDDSGYWQQLESYVSRHSEAQFSHGICPDCMKKLYPEEYERLRLKNPDLFDPY
jgi:PAS domain S-box-containing protein